MMITGEEAVTIGSRGTMIGIIVAAMTIVADRVTTIAMIKRQNCRKILVDCDEGGGSFSGPAQ